MKEITWAHLYDTIAPQSLDALIDSLNELDVEKKELLLELKNLSDKDKIGILKFSSDEIMDIIDEFLKKDLLDGKDRLIHLETLNKISLEGKNEKLQDAKKYLEFKENQLKVMERSASTMIKNYLMKRVEYAREEIKIIEREIDEAISYNKNLDLNKDGVLEFSEYIKMFIGE